MTALRFSTVLAVFFSAVCLVYSENKSVNVGDQAGANCSCTKEYEPQCTADGETVAANPCNAKCIGYSPDEVSLWNCDFMKGVATPAPTSCLEGCSNRTGKGPVCDAAGSELAGSACKAECMGYPPASFSEDNCGFENRLAALCGCDANNAKGPVCNAAGKRVFESECVARCLGYEEGFLSRANCGVKEKICICPLVYAPMCDEKGVPLAGNGCEAACYGEDIARYRNLSRETCERRRSDAVACGCEGAPQVDMCDAMGSFVASSKCVASCAGYVGAIPCSQWTQAARPTEVEVVPFIADGGAAPSNGTPGEVLEPTDDAVQKVKDGDGLGEVGPGPRSGTPMPTDGDIPMDKTAPDSSLRPSVQTPSDALGPLEDEANFEDSEASRSSPRPWIPLLQAMALALSCTMVGSLL